MILTDLIREQVFQCAVMMGAGILVMIFYQIFKCTCSLLIKSGPVLAVIEVVFWAVAAVAAAHFLYYCAYGRLSFHAALSFTAGALLWKKFFYDIIDKIYTSIRIKQGNNKYGEEEKKQPVQRYQSGNRH